MAMRDLTNRPSLRGRSPRGQRPKGVGPWLPILIFLIVLVALIRGCVDSMPSHHGSPPPVTHSSR